MMGYVTQRRELSERERLENAVKLNRGFLGYHIGEAERQKRYAEAAALQVAEAERQLMEFNEAERAEMVAAASAVPLSPAETWVENWNAAATTGDGLSMTLLDQEARRLVIPDGHAIVDDLTRPAAAGGYLRRLVRLDETAATCA